MMPLLSDAAHEALKVLPALGSRFSLEQAAEEIVNRVPGIRQDDDSFEAVWEELIESNAVVRMRPGKEQDLVEVYAVATPEHDEPG